MGDFDLDTVDLDTGVDKTAIRVDAIARLKAAAIIGVGDKVYDSLTTKQMEANAPCLSVATTGGTWTRWGSKGHGLRFKRELQLTVAGFVIIGKGEKPDDPDATLSAKVDALEMVVMRVLFEDVGWVSSFEGIPRVEDNQERGTNGKSRAGGFFLDIVVQYSDRFEISAVSSHRANLDLIETTIHTGGDDDPDTVVKTDTT